MNLLDFDVFIFSPGHTCIIVFKYADNMDLRKDVEKEFWFQTVTNATFSVDTFFFIRYGHKATFLGSTDTNQYFVTENKL